MKALLIAMRRNPTLAVWCHDESEIPAKELGKYTEALQKDNQKERDRLPINRVTNPTQSERNTGVSGPRELFAQFAPPFD